MAQYPGKAAAMKPIILSLLLLSAHSITAQPVASDVYEPASISSLRTIPDETLATVRGEVTLADHAVFLQDSTGGIHVIAKSIPDNLRTGDQVIATGRLLHGRYADSLMDGKVIFLFAGLPTPPLAVTATMASSGRYDNMLLETEGRLVYIERTASGITLLLHSEHQEFVAELPSALLPTLPPIPKLDSLVRVRGVCVINSSSDQYRVPFRILMRSANDQEVLSGPPFWTRTHVALLGFALLLVAVAASMIYLRAQRWRFRSVLEERTRLAHDLHDTLAQSFAGIGFQLQAINGSLFSGHQDAKKHVDLAISLVADCHADARRAISMLKPLETVTGDLLQALKQQGEQLTRGGEIRLEISTEGSPVELSEIAQQTLLRIGHEAVINAIRHAQAKTITMTLAYRSDETQLDIHDDGIGFAPEDQHRHGFGLMAMRARALSQNGRFHLTSQPRAGTTIRVILPLSPIKRPTIRQHFRRYL
jgi:signal transduction histidine kinase